MIGAGSGGGGGGVTTHPLPCQLIISLSFIIIFPLSFYFRSYYYSGYCIRDMT